MPKDHIENSLDSDAKLSVSGMLHSLSGEWDNFYPSKSNQNAFTTEADKIDALEETLDLHPQTMKFMYEVTKLHYNALNDSPKHQELKQSLASLADYISSVTYDAQINDEIELSEDQLQILDVIKMKTAQDAANAAHKFLKQIGAGMSHVTHELKEHPKSCAAFGSIGIGSLWFMNQKLGGKIYLDPTLMTATNITNSDVNNISEMSDDALFGDVDDGTAFEGTSTFDVNELDTLDTDMQFGVHSELGQALNIESEKADALRENNPLMDFLFPEKGFTLDTYVYDAQQNLVEGYEFIYGERYEFGLKESTLDMGAALVPHPELFTAYTKGAELLTDFWTGYDWVENIAVHPPMTIFTMLAVYKLGTMNAGEFAEFKGELKDTWHQATTASRLPYLGAATGMTASAIMNSGLDPSIVWMGLAGMLAGETAKRMTLKSKNSEFIQTSTASIKETLQSFNDPNLLLSNGRAGDIKSITEQTTSNWSKAAAVTAGTVAVGTTLDYLTTGGQITAGTVGGAVVTAKFWAINAVQELGLHGLFAGMGAILGGVGIAVKRGYDALLSSNKHDDHHHDNSNTPD